MKSFQKRPTTVSDNNSILVPLKWIEEKQNDLDVITSTENSPNYTINELSRFTNRFQKFKKFSESERKERVHFRNSKYLDHLKIIGHMKREISNWRIKSPEKTVASQRNRSHSSMAEYISNKRDRSFDYLDVPRTNNIFRGKL